MVLELDLRSKETGLKINSVKTKVSTNTQEKLEIILEEKNQPEQVLEYVHSSQGKPRSRTC